MSSNLEKLQAAGVVAADAELSDAEKSVIEGMSDDEVETLTALRQRLDEEIAKQGTTAIASGDATPSANFVI